MLIFFCQFEILQEDPVNLEITLIWSQSFISIAYQQILLIFCIDRFRNCIYFPESDPTHVSGHVQALWQWQYWWSWVSFSCNELFLQHDHFRIVHPEFTDNVQSRINRFCTIFGHCLMTTFIDVNVFQVFWGDHSMISSSPKPQLSTTTSLLSMVSSTVLSSLLNLT